MKFSKTSSAQSCLYRVTCENLSRIRALESYEDIQSLLQYKNGVSVYQCWLLECIFKRGLTKLQIDSFKSENVVKIITALKEIPNFINKIYYPQMTE